MLRTSAHRADGGIRPAETHTTGNLALAPSIGQPILTGSRAIPNSAPLIKRLLNIRLDDHAAKLILVTAGAYCNPWTGEDGGVCLAANRTLWELAEVSRTTFIAKWKKLKGLGLVHVRRRGPGKTAEIIIRTGSPSLAEVSDPDTSRSVRSRHFSTYKDPELGSVSSPIAAVGRSRARTTDRRKQQQHDRDQARLEGLIAAVASRARQLGHDFDEDDERRRLDAREIDVAALQALADDLNAELTERGDVRHHRVTPGLDGARCAVCGRRPSSDAELCPGRPRRTRIQALVEDRAAARNAPQRAG